MTIEPVEGRVYVATERAIQVWDLATGTPLATFGTPAELALAISIARDRDGTLPTGSAAPRRTIGC